MTTTERMQLERKSDQKQLFFMKGFLVFQVLGVFALLMYH